LLLAVQPTGDHFDDCVTGHRFAVAYLRYLAEERSSELLMSIVDDMCAALAQREHSGIELGFLRAIESARSLGGVKPRSGFSPESMPGECMGKVPSSTSDPMAPW
jgi:hypothetical protein